MRMRGEIVAEAGDVNPIREDLGATGVAIALLA